MNLSIDSTRRMHSGLALLCLILAIPFRSTQAPAAEAAKLAREFSYQHVEVPEKPWSIHVVKVDLSNHDLTLHTSLGKGAQLGLATLSDQVKSIPPALGRPIAAVNGDYYRNEYPYVGDPKGLQIMRGELVSSPSDWTCFWMDPSGNPSMTNVLARFEVTWPGGAKIPFGLNEERASDAAVLFTCAVGSSTRTSGGREFVLERNGAGPWLPLQASQSYSARVRAVRETGDTPLSKDILVLSVGRSAAAHLPQIAPGAVVQLSTATWPDLKGVTTALGGGPRLLLNGRLTEHETSPVRHPRSAIGWNHQYFFMVEVDGRQRDLSVGMTMRELALFMQKIGCEEAMSLDGGGSATCWVYGQIMNSPSEGRERPMANALVLVHKEKTAGTTP